MIALSALAVALAALMIPATGLGSVPAGPSVTGLGPAPSDAGADAPDPTDEPDPGDASDEPSPSPGEPTRTDTPGTNDPDETAGGTATPSPTATPTSTPADAGGADEGSDGAVGVTVAVLVALVAFATVGAVFEGKARRWPVFRRLPVPAVSPVEAGRSIPQATMAFVVRLSSSVPRLVSGLGTAAGAASIGLSVGLRAVGRGLGALVVSVPRGVGGALLSVPGGLAGVFSDAGETDRIPSDAGSVDPFGAATSAEDESDDPPPTSVEGAWLAMTERIPVRREAKTPAELARIAVDRGFPAEPVEALTESFRRVAYGGVAPTDEATERALGALERIERRLEGDE